jgi:hypothetical protein
MTTLEDRYVVDVFPWKELSFQVTEEKSYMNTASKIGPLKKHKEVTEGGRILILCHWGTKDDKIYFLFNTELVAELYNSEDAWLVGLLVLQLWRKCIVAVRNWPAVDSDCCRPNIYFS